MLSRQSPEAPFEHGSSRLERYLRANRFKLALIVVIAEALLVAFGVLSFWVSLVIAACLLVLFVLFHRDLHGWLRELAWIVAFSQSAGVLVFALALAAVILLVVAVVGLALAVLGLLLFGRRF